MRKLPDGRIFCFECGTSQPLRFGLQFPLMPQRSFTEKQGQYLSFIFYYTKIHGCAPAEADLQWYFKVSPPTVHQMILALENQRLIERVPGQARSIRLLVDRKYLPELE